MKKTILTFIAFLLCASTFATIRRVNNNPGVITNTAGPAFVYNNFFDAMAAASTAVTDTIYLEPSDINYGDIRILKKIVLIGPGYFLDKNPNTPFDKRQAKVSAIEISSSSIPSGTIIYGITVQHKSGTYGNVLIGAPGSGPTVVEVSIVSCIFNSLSIIGIGGSNHTLQKCFITGDISSLSSNSVLSNCIILGSVVSGTNNTIKNNVVFGGISSTTLGNIFNNIIFPGSTAALSFPNESNVYNNVCVGCAGTPSFNNFFTTAANTVFQVAEPRILDDLWDERFKLSVSSPAKAKGVAGVDCGVFAGTNPYVLSGIPPFPMITAFTQGAPVSGNIPITISIKRN